MALPDYLQDTAKDYAKQATGAYSVPIDTSKFTGSQFVAGEDPLQTSAINLAQQGVGSYSPYLTAAQQGLTQAGTDLGAARTAAGGLGALTGPTAYQPFMSPYQQDVIDTTLGEFDKQAQIQQQGLRDAALGVPGAFGGGREGVQQAEYQTASDRNRALLQAGLLQQGFGQAQSAAQQAFGNQQAIAQGQLGLGQAQLGLGREQMGLSNFQRAGLGQDVGMYGQLGSLRQAQEQARLTAQQQAAQTAAYEPYGRLSQYGQGITGLTGGVAAAQYAEPQQQSPMSQALSTALGIGGLYQKIFHPQPIFGT
jgi:hypothetical protein|tara:strand:+ start:415 stop:1341 length:927 start_codon:yes stop_codon:yes gene_type:complete